MDSGKGGGGTQKRKKAVAHLLAWPLEVGARKMRDGIGEIQNGIDGGIEGEKK